MKIKKLLQTFSIFAALSVATPANAVLIDFTGGTVYQFGGATGTTNTMNIFENVDYYEEDGIKFDFIGPSGNPFSYNIGNYYGVGNDVIHGHWDAGPFGDMDSILVNKINGETFDLNYFKITSNTSSGGAPASGSEEVYLNALADGVNISYSQLLPPDDWGFAGPNSEIFLGSEFDDILAFSVTYGSGAVGFGMDEFFIDEQGPPNPQSSPEPSTLLSLIALTVIGKTIKRKQ